jgi:hypothetical protein
MFEYFNIWWRKHFDIWHFFGHNLAIFKHKKLAYDFFGFHISTLVLLVLTSQPQTLKKNELIIFYSFFK